MSRVNSQWHYACVSGTPPPFKSLPPPPPGSLWGHQPSDTQLCPSYTWAPGSLSTTLFPLSRCKAMERRGLINLIPFRLNKTHLTIDSLKFSLCSFFCSISLSDTEVSSHIRNQELLRSCLGHTKDTTTSGELAPCPVQEHHLDMHISTRSTSESRWFEVNLGNIKWNWLKR